MIVVSATIVTEAVAAYEAVYKITCLSPTKRELGSLTLVRAGNRASLEFTAKSITNLCVYTPKYTFVSDEKQPVRNAKLYEPEATGWFAWAPLLPGDLLTWNPLRPDKSDRTKAKAANMQIIGRGGKHFWQPAEVSFDSAGKIESVSTIHNNTTECKWAYEGYRDVQASSIPTVIVRSRFRASGLNIPADDSVEWRLVGMRNVPDDQLSDVRLLANGAPVQDNRSESLGASGIYSRTGGPMEEQLSKFTPTPSSRSEGGFGTILLLSLAGVVGLILGVLGFRRALTMRAQEVRE